MSERSMTNRTVRSIRTEFTTREDGEDLFIEGYFAVFDSNYNVFPGATESIDSHAFDEALMNDDVRALINHDTTLVLGRTKANTLTLEVHPKGLFGRIRINPNDSDAMNMRARVLRGDVDQCSFGFDILDEETTYRDDGTIHWTIRKVKLWEVSCCTFPAYDQTSITAREHDLETVKKRQLDTAKAELLKRLKGE